MTSVLKENQAHSLAGDREAQVGEVLGSEILISVPLFKNRGSC